MLAKIKFLFAKLSDHPRLRILVIVLGVIFTLTALIHMLGSSHDAGNGAPPSNVQPVSVDANAHKTAVTSTATTQYNQLADVSQKRQFQSQVAAGSSIFENPFDNSSATSPSSVSVSSDSSDTAETEINAAGDASTSGKNASNTASNNNGTSNTSATVSPQQFAQNQKNQQQTQEQTPQQAAANNPQLQAQINQLQQQLQQQTTQNSQVTQIQGSMTSAVGNLTSSWSIPVAATVQGTPEPLPTADSTPTKGPIIIKAGTIIFGVINTALDSDNPGTPVMATIVTGKYRGAKLLGAFTSQNNSGGSVFQSSALVVQFNMMSLPNVDENVSINAYALDQNTANNAIASSVDNHYLLRYGMLFASSFLQGFGNAYQNYNYTCPPGTVNCTSINSNGTPNAQATSKTAMYQGFGQIGTNLSTASMNVFNNTPPTIKVDQGTGIGVLFMSDVSLPAN